MSDTSSSSSDDDDISVDITLKYEKFQKKTKFDFDYKNLIKKAKKKFKNIKKEDKLIFYYVDNNAKKQLIDEKINLSDFEELYNKCNKNLIIIVSLKSENQEKENQLLGGNKVIEIKVQKEENKSDDELYSNISMENSDYNPQSEDRNNFIEDVNIMANKIKKVTKTEENKQTPNQLKEKCSFESDLQKFMSSELYQSSALGNKKNIEDMKNMINKYNSNKQQINDMTLKNEKIEQKIKDTKILIEQAENENNNNDDDDNELTKNDFEEKKQKILKDIEKLEKQKNEEIENIKKQNAEIVKSMKEVSNKLTKQKEENKKLEELNENLSQDNFEQINSYESSNNNKLFILKRNENEKKNNKIRKINEIMKESELKKPKDTINKLAIIDEEKKEEELIINLFPKIVNKKLNENINNIKKVNNKMKNEIKELENKINNINIEIKDMKIAFEEEIKNLQED